MKKSFLSLPCNSFYNHIIVILLTLSVSFFSIKCSGDTSKPEQVVVIGASSDVATINPLYAFSLQEGHLLDLLFLKPFMETWNDSLGDIEFIPLLVENYQINTDSGFITLYIRDNIFWSDGKPITSDDFIFSFDVYSDPVVNSRLYGLFEDFYISEDLHIDVNRSFRKNSDKSLTIYFKNINTFTLLDINHSILPKHAYIGLKKEEFETAEINFNPVTSGPYKLSKWDRDQKIHLTADTSCFVYNSENVQTIIFKIIPDDFSMVTQLEKGEIDIIEDLDPERVKDIEKNENININYIKGRNYDYVGWNHIDPVAFSKKKSKPNKLFGSPKIRKALSLAINRNEIFNSIIGKHGEIYDSPISPVFKKYYNDRLNKVEYDPAIAKKIFEEEGWRDNNGNGIIDKNGIEFSFNIYANTGNPVREYSATVIKNNLKEIGVDAEVLFVEKNELVDGLISRKYDAWISGWSIEIPLNLESYWTSDPQKSMLNFVNFSNEELEKIFSKLKTAVNTDEKVALYKNLSEIFIKEEPVTFLFWTNNIIVCNKRIKNLIFSPLGLFTNAWEWKIEK